MGSMAWSGFKPISAFADVTDPDGVRFGDALAVHLAAEADIPRRGLGHVPHAYVEAHIEQGPRLEAEDLDIGIVTGIQGSHWFNVTLHGESAHAGTAPVSLRRDAVQDMVRVLTALNALMHDPTDVLRYTVGRVTVLPNSSNSVAHTASFSIDLRHPDDAVLSVRARAVEGVVQSALRCTTATVEQTFAAAPTKFHPHVIDAVERAAQSLGYRAVRMPSGAFHDAQFVVPIAPSGMIFVPSRRGISHNPAEYTAPDQLAAGTRVLAKTLIDLAA
jgi:N-carbamoyl-L-amino-acid hydrolase